MRKFSFRTHHTGAGLVVGLTYRLQWRNKDGNDAKGIGSTLNVSKQRDIDNR